MIKRFADGLRGVPDAEQRKMFGYPAAFLRGNMVLPDEFIGSPGTLGKWLGRAREYAASLPPKKGAARGKKGKSGR